MFKKWNEKIASQVVRCKHIANLSLKTFSCISNSILRHQSEQLRLWRWLVAPLADSVNTTTAI